MRDVDDLPSDYKDKLAERAHRSTSSWYQSESLRYKIYWEHKEKDEGPSSQANTFEEIEKNREALCKYRKHCRALSHKQLIIGKPRKKKTISLKFAIRKSRQDTISLREKSASVRVPGFKSRLSGRHNRILPTTSQELFKEGVLKQDSCGDFWLCLVLDGQRPRELKPSDEWILIGSDCGLKHARTVVAIHALTGEIVNVFQPERVRHFDKSLKALKWASNHDTRALPFVHRKIARRRLDGIDKEIKRILELGHEIKIGKPSAIWLFAGRLARSAMDVANSKFVERLVKRAEEAGKKSGLVNESGTSVTCRKCGQKKKMPLDVRTYECPCGHIEDRDINAAYQIALRAFEEVA
jgi:putative transposase